MASRPTFCATSYAIRGRQPCADVEELADAYNRGQVIKHSCDFEFRNNLDEQPLLMLFSGSACALTTHMSTDLQL